VGARDRRTLEQSNTREMLSPSPTRASDACLFTHSSSRTRSWSAPAASSRSTSRQARSSGLLPSNGMQCIARR
jgi:hypothetical protein